MKKYISLILAALVCLTLCACSQPEPDNSSDELKALLTEISGKLDDLAEDEPTMPEKPLEGVYTHTVNGNTAFEFFPDGTCIMIDYSYYSHISGRYEATNDGWRVFFGDGSSPTTSTYYEITANGDVLTVTGGFPKQTKEYTKQ